MNNKKSFCKRRVFMRILHISKYYYPYIGGVEKRVRLSSLSEVSTSMATSLRALQVPWAIHQYKHLLVLSAWVMAVDTKTAAYCLYTICLGIALRQSISKWNSCKTHYYIYLWTDYIEPFFCFWLHFPYPNFEIKVDGLYPLLLATSSCLSQVICGVWISQSYGVLLCASVL